MSDWRDRFRDFTFKPWLKPITRAQFDSGLACFDDADENALLEVLDELGYATAPIRAELAAEEAARGERGRIYREEQRAKMTPREREIDDNMAGALAGLADKIGDDFFQSNVVLNAVKGS